MLRRQDSREEASKSVIFRLTCRLAIRFCDAPVPRVDEESRGA